jgi:hypothetical protein
MLSQAQWQHQIAGLQAYIAAQRTNSGLYDRESVELFGACGGPAARLSLVAHNTTANNINNSNSNSTNTSSSSSSVSSGGAGRAGLNMLTKAIALHCQQVCTGSTQQVRAQTEPARPNTEL